MKRVLAIALLIPISGCSFTGPNSIDRTNEMIHESNKGRLESFATAMSACEEKPGCLVAVSMAFAGNMGQQNLLRPESTLDYIREVRMWVDPVGNLIDRLNGGTGGTSGDRAANVVKGDGNVILVGNRASADNGSTAGFSLSNAYTRSWNGYNRDYTGQQPITDEGVGIEPGVQ